MAERVCPWWLGYFLASPVRRWLMDPTVVIQPYVREGMTVLEPGPGMGFFTVELARKVGPKGRVVAVDVQPKMIAGLKRRSAKAGILDRIDARVAPADSMGLVDLAGAVDFTLAFAMVHEMPSATRFFVEAAAASKPGANLLFVEPAGHVKDAKFDEELQAARQAGFALVDRPQVRRSHAALLRKEKAA
jgi:ubiquinone/menaquinone biosynthesis C-methylase UbiE